MTVATAARGHAKVQFWVFRPRPGHAPEFTVRARLGKSLRRSLPYKPLYTIYNHTTTVVGFEVVLSLDKM
jgi:hypothetical protein